jgi:repressor LexA
MRKSSDIQQRIMNYIHNFMESNYGHSPTYREIQDALNLSSPSVVNYHLKKLEKDGRLRLSNGKSRLITIVKMVETEEASNKVVALNKGLRGARTVRVPFCGFTAAGEPIPHRMDADPENVIEVSPVMLGSYTNRSDEILALKVKGESMIDAGILDGDIVLIKSQKTAEVGEKVVVWLNGEGEATLKKWYPEKDKDQVCLRSANPAMKPIYAQLSKVRIVGKYISSMRTPTD